MERRRLLMILLLVITIPFLIGPLVIPVEDVVFHNTQSSAAMLSSESVNETLVEKKSGQIYEYNNLSDRAKSLYVKALKNDGKYSVPVGEGAPEFEYITESEAKEMDMEKALNKSQIIVKRPVDSDLPPPDERTNSTRYDLMTIGKEEPDFPSEQHTTHVVMAIIGLAGLCLTGYLFVTDPERT